ncbi:MAG: hypothetical protein HY775_11280 [Acidobacteria bacterium]|nr:hypothetical protein [Acidobacteriota bacterium]
MMDRRYRIGLGFALAAAGVVVAIAGWMGVSNETEVAFQLPYFASAGVGALLLFGAAATLLLSAQFDRDESRVDDLERAVRGLAEEVARLADELTPARGATPAILGTDGAREPERAARASASR